MKISLIRMLQLSSAALVVTALSFGSVTAAEKKKEAAKPAPTAEACKGIKAEAACEARSDCTWVAASKKGSKQKRDAHCRAKPKAKANKKT
jgi:hypothetical protein